MIVATVFGKIISIFIIMIVGVICCKMGIIDDYTKQRLSRLSTLVVNPILIFTSFQMEYDSELLKKMGLLFVLAVISYLRIDTHADNQPMQNAIDSYGFCYCGIIHVADGTPRNAYDLV